MRNARLDEAQVEIKIAGININNLRYADDLLSLNTQDRAIHNNCFSLSLRLITFIFFEVINFKIEEMACNLFSKQ